MGQNTTITPLLSGSLGALIVFILGVIYNTYQNSRQKRIENRAFINIDEISGANYRLNNVNTNNNRILVTKNYNDILELQPENASFNFTKIKNLGNGHTINCNIEIHILRECDSKKDIIKGYVPVIEEEEEIYICTTFLDNLAKVITIERTEISYESRVGEKLKLISETKLEDNERFVTNTVLYKRIFKYKELSSSKFSNTSWIFTE